MRAWVVAILLLHSLPGMSAGDGLALPDGRPRLGMPAEPRLPAGEADYQLSLRHFAGEGVTRDAQKALGYLEQAARAGHPEACFNLGNYHNLYTGQPDEAARWWREAARAGHAQALHNLAEALAAGLIRPQPGESAEAYRQKAQALAGEAAHDGPAADLVQAPAAAEAAPVAPAASLRNQAAQAPAAGVTAGVAGGEVWRHLPDDAATIQIFASIRQDEVRQMSRRHAFRRPLALLSFERNGQPWHALLYGQFADVPAARRALAELPPALRASKPWARRLGDVRAQTRVRFDTLPAAR